MKKFILKLLLLWFSIILANVSILVISAVLQTEQQTELKGKIEYVAAFFLVATLGASRFIFQNRLQDALKKSILKEKMQGYLSAVIICGAVIETGGVLCSVVYILTKTTWILGGSLASITVMLLQIPTADKCQADLELTPEELEMLETL